MALKPKELSGNYMPINKVGMFILTTTCGTVSFSKKKIKIKKDYSLWVATCSVETEVKGSSKNDQDFDDTINSSLVEYTMRNVISLEWNK